MEAEKAEILLHAGEEAQGFVIAVLFVVELLQEIVGGLVLSHAGQGARLELAEADVAGKCGEALTGHVVGEQGLAQAVEYAGEQHIGLGIRLPGFVVTLCPKSVQSGVISVCGSTDGIEQRRGLLRGGQLRHCRRRGGRTDGVAHCQQRLDGAHSRAAVVFLFGFGKLGVGNEAGMLFLLVVAGGAVTPPIGQSPLGPDVVRVLCEQFRDAAEFGGQLEGSDIKRLRIVRQFMSLVCEPAPICESDVSA